VIGVSGHAQIIVTGDKDLLIIENYQDIEILTPKDFLTHK